MMNQWYFLPFAVLCNTASAFLLAEFGRQDHVEHPRWTRMRLPDWEQSDLSELDSFKDGNAGFHKKTREISRLLQDLEEFLDVSDEISVFSLSMSMSMSMFMSDEPLTPSSSLTLLPVPTIASFPTTTTTSPTPSPITPPAVPTSISTAPPSLVNVPTVNSNTTTSSPVPSNTPSDTSETSDAPSILFQTVRPTVDFDNFTEVPIADTPAFECDGNGSATLGSANEDGSTLMFLVIGYKVESTSTSTQDFQDALENLLLETAVLAALGGCDNNVTQRRQTQEMDDDSWSHRHLLVETMVVGSCEATLNETESCTILESEIIFYLKGLVDPDVAAFVSYSAIQEHMAQDKYIGAIPTLLLVEYLSPLPLVPPPSFPANGTGANDNVDSGDNPATIQSTATADRLSVSPWTIGACVATVMGGVISLLVYSRNRQARQRRGGQDRHRSYGPSSDMEYGVRNPITI